MNENKYLLKYIFTRGFVIAAAKFITIPIFFLQSVIVVRFWGVDARGNIAVYLAAINIVYLLFSFGLPSAILYFTKKYPLQINLFLKWSFFTLLFLGINLFFIFLVINSLKLSIFEKLIDEQVEILYFVGFVFLFLSAVSESLLLANRNIKLLVSSKLIRAIFSFLIYCCVVIYYDLAVISLLYCLFVTDIAISLIIIGKYYFADQTSISNKTSYYPFLRYGLILSLMPVLPTTLNFGATLILNQYSSSYSVGLWAIALSLCNFMVVALKPIGVLTFTETVEKSLQEVLVILRSSVHIIVLLFSIFFIVSIFLAEEILTWIYGAEAIGAVIVLLALIPIVGLQTIAGQVHSILMGQGEQVYLTSINIVLALIFIAVSFPLVEKYFVYGLLGSLAFVRAVHIILLTIRVRQLLSL